MAIVELNTNLLNDTSGPMDVSSALHVTMYVVDNSGAHLNHRVSLEVSPDNGATWITETPLVGLGCRNYDLVTLQVRVRVTETEGAPSTVFVHILAR